MAELNLKKKIISKLRYKYRLIFFNEQTYEEVFMLHLSRLNVFTYFGSAALVIIIMVTFLIAFTPLREYIPGYPTGVERRMILKNTQRVDSLVIQLDKRDRLIQNIRAIMSGDIIEGRDSTSNQQTADLNKNQSIKFKKSSDDSIFRAQIEEEEKYNLTINQNKGAPLQIEQIFFFTPLKGIIVNKFGQTKGHYGIDITAADESRVSAIMDGTIVFTGWTVETGYVIQIQHRNNIISFYKHNSRLLKKMGNVVKAGEAIAQVGNSGELTTGTHLHFEMWYNGAPVDPENYISFH